MSKSLIALMLPSFVVFGGPAPGYINGPLKPLGDPRPPVEESIVDRTADSPQALLAGVLAAIARGDRAWLARSLASTARRAPLTEAELSVVWLRFEWPRARAVWDRVAAAHAAGGGRFEVDGTRATVTWGDGLGLAFVELEEAGWCIADG